MYCNHLSLDMLKKLGWVQDFWFFWLASHSICTFSADGKIVNRGNISCYGWFKHLAQAIHSVSDIWWTNHNSQHQQPKSLFRSTHTINMMTHERINTRVNWRCPGLCSPPEVSVLWQFGNLDDGIITEHISITVIMMSADVHLQTVKHTKPQPIMVIYDISMLGKTPFHWVSSEYEARTDLCHDIMWPDVRGQRDVGLTGLCLRRSQQCGAKHCGQIMQRHLIDRLLLCHPEMRGNKHQYRTESHLIKPSSSWTQFIIMCVMYRVGQQVSTVSGVDNLSICCVSYSWQ